MATAGVDVVMIVGNIAKGGIVSSNFYLKYIYLYEKRYVGALTDQGGKILFHNCGKCANLLEVYKELLSRNMRESFPSLY